MNVAPPPWSARRPMIAGILTLILLIGGIGGWSVLTTLSGAIIAPGRVEVAQNRQIVQHPDGGVVSRIAVAEGDSVAAGDLLIRLDGVLLRSELAIVENQLHELVARRGRLEAEQRDAPVITFAPQLIAALRSRPEVSAMVDAQRVLFLARRDKLNRQIAQLSRQSDQITGMIDGIVAQKAALTKQLGLLAAELESQQSLYDKGLARIDRVLALRRESARLQGEVGGLEVAQAQADGRMAAIEGEKLDLAAERRDDALRELREMASLEREAAERLRVLTERVARLDIRAPVAGVVLGLQVTTPRAVLRPAEPVLYLIPQDGPLVISAQVPVVNIDEVGVGQPVRLHFAGLVADGTPDLRGQVVVISADALTDNVAQAAYYRVKIALEPGESGKLRGAKLRPGMPVDAYIRTGDRTPLAFLTKPFTDYFKRALREG